MKLDLKIKRVYDKPEDEDGLRILVDRLWPRGISKEKVKIYKWMKDIAPSDSLRKWFGHRAERWDEFKKRYHEELKEKKKFLEELRTISEKETITLLFSAKDIEQNNARALLDFVKRR